jgi:hypothetical protein
MSIDFELGKQQGQRAAVHGDQPGRARAALPRGSHLPRLFLDRVRARPLGRSVNSAGQGPGGSRCRCSGMVAREGTWRDGHWEAPRASTRRKDLTACR